MRRSLLLAKRKPWTPHIFKGSNGRYQVSQRPLPMEPSLPLPRVVRQLWAQAEAFARTYGVG